MTASSYAQILIYVLVVLALTKPIGAFMAAVFEGRRTFLYPLLRPLGWSCPAGIPFERTRTHDLDPTSPARDSGIALAGGNAFLDQRYVSRPQGVGTDIGAVEYSPSTCAWFFADGFEHGNTFGWSNVVE